MSAPLTWRCASCDAAWSEGAHTEGCEECGGGAMTRPCVLCGGRCGATVQRMPLDSIDHHLAHWIGGCRLDREAQLRLMREQVDREGADP